MSHPSFINSVDALANMTTLTSVQKIEKLYDFVSGYKENMCDWYWQGIARKRRSAFYLLILVFLLVIVATIIQIVVVNYYKSNEDRFFYSQVAFGLFAVSVVLFVVDKVFGWTSGWIRYIKTVLDIEISYADFLSQWLMNIDTNSTHPDLCYKNAILLAKNIIQVIKQHQKKETDEWSLQFGDSLNQLGALIKSSQQPNKQNDPSQNNNQHAASTLTAAGALNVKLNNFSTASPVKITLTKESVVIREETLSHSEWGVINLVPAIYLLELKINDLTVTTHAIQIESGKIAQFIY